MFYKEAKEIMGKQTTFASMSLLVLSLHLFDCILGLSSAVEQG